MQERTVLVVEDDPAISELVTELLDDAGYTVLTANLGRRGLRLAEQHAPSVMLVNNRLPDMSGLDLLERLRRHDATRRIPVVLVSGRSPRLSGDGTAEGSAADRVLPMPFDIDVLLTHVEQLALSGSTPAA
jgi:DNA-binding response OmpR family regulator